MVNEDNYLKQRTDAIRKDFMTGGGKMNSYTDPLRKQVPNYANKGRLNYRDIDAMYRDSALIQNIVNIPAEDMIRAGFEILTDNEQLRLDLENKLDELCFKETFEKALKYKRKYGDGFIAIGTVEGQEFELSDPLDIKSVQDIEYLHAFSPKKVSSVELNNDIFSSDYGTPEYYIISGATEGQRVHPSRIIRFNEEIEEDEVYGRSILEPMKDIMTILDTSIWSTGQILFDYTFKVMKSKDVESMTKSEVQESRILMDYMFRTEALALLAPDEELERHTVPIQGIGELLNFMWETLSGSAKMPKNVILGQQQGTITGGQYDILNYFNRVEAQQENVLKPKIQNLIDLLLNTKDINKPNAEYDIQFRSLWSLDEQEKAGVKKTLAEIDQIYMSWDVLSPEQIAEMRFGDYGIAGELDFSQADSKDIEYVKQLKQEGNKQ